MCKSVWREFAPHHFQIVAKMMTNRFTRKCANLFGASLLRITLESRRKCLQTHLHHNVQICLARVCCVSFWNRGENICKQIYTKMCKSVWRDFAAYHFKIVVTMFPTRFTQQIANLFGANLLRITFKSLWKWLLTDLHQNVQICSAGVFSASL